VCILSLVHPESPATQVEQDRPVPSWIKSALAALIPVRKRFDPSVIADPVAQQIEWSPAKGGGANFCTHKLVEVDPNRLEFKPTLLAWGFYLVFAVPGAGVVLAAVLGSNLSRQSVLSLEVGVPILLGSFFLVIGTCMLYFGTAPIVFDKYRSCFWKGRKGPADVADPRALKHFAPLGEIYALQILSERCSSKNGSYHSYELNLVLCDKRRINVVDHGNLRRLREDAQALSRFLAKPVWDGLT
jgi:hypothetical protein